jgi:predicted acylesterase/phospholipase RssA
MNGTQRRLVAMLTGILAIVPACSTLDIVRGFNDSPHGTIGDPSVTPAGARRRLLARMIVDETTGAYFSPDGTSAYFVYAKNNFPQAIRHLWNEQTGSSNSDAANDPSRPAQRGKGTRLQPSDLRAAMDADYKSSPPPWEAVLSQPPTPNELCDRGDTLSDKARRLADAVRFQAAYETAVRTAYRWCVEGLLQCKEGDTGDGSLTDGATAGFDEAAKYLKNRRWKRDPKRYNLGLAISGGASNGMFSAGATWVLLNIVDGCMHDRDCKNADPRFRLISGTSAGAMIATAVDLYTSAYDDGGDGKGQTVIRELAQWFTCMKAQQLYCADNAITPSLFEDRVGIARFDGLTWLLSNTANRGMLTNTSELFLNTVDFQSGELLSPSDQDPDDTRAVCDLVDHSVASAPEPLIANPNVRLRLGASASASTTATRRKGFYLDGGVRSVVPMLPLIRHGADRTVIVSSGASLVSGSTPPGNALDLLQRYIDISTTTNGDDGASLAEALAAVRSSREEAICLNSMNCGVPGRRGAPATTPDELSCATFCSGDVQRACPAPKSAPKATGDTNLYPVEELYRNEVKIDPAAGYSFDPTQSLPLFLAGAAAVRERCLEFARFMGVSVAASTVVAWCNTPVPTPAICADTNWPLPQFKDDPATTVRPCDDSVWSNRGPLCK